MTNDKIPNDERMTKPECQFAPKGPKLVSPGQGDASSASVAAALGTMSISLRTLKGRNNAGTIFVLTSFWS